MAVVAKLRREAGFKYYVAGDGRVMGGRDLKRASATSTRITRKPGHLYFVDGAGDVHERKAKYA